MVLRRPPLGEILASAHDMEREHRILSGLAAAGARVPQTLAYCDDAEVTGAPFYVMEHVDGLIVTKVETAERLAPEARAAAARSLVQTLTASCRRSTSTRPGSATSSVPRAWRAASSGAGHASGTPRRRRSCR